MKALNTYPIDELYQIMADYPSLESGVKGLIAGKSYQDLTWHLQHIDSAIPEEVRRTLVHYLYNTMGWEALSKELKPYPAQWMVPYLPISKQEALEALIKDDHSFLTRIAVNRVWSQRWCDLDFYQALAKDGNVMDAANLRPTEDLLRYLLLEKPLPRSAHRYRMVSAAVQIGYDEILGQLPDNHQELNYWRLTHGVNTHLVPLHTIQEQPYFELLGFWAAQYPSPESLQYLEGHRFVCRVGLACGGYTSKQLFNKLSKAQCKRLQAILDYQHLNPQASPLDCLQKFLPKVYQALSATLKEGKLENN